MLGGYLLVVDQFGDFEGKKLKGLKIFFLFESFLVLVLLNLVVLGLRIEKKGDVENDQDVFIFVNENENIMKDVIVVVCMRSFWKVLFWKVVLWKVLKDW